MGVELRRVATPLQHIPDKATMILVEDSASSRGLAAPKIKVIRIGNSCWASESGGSGECASWTSGFRHMSRSTALEAYQRLPNKSERGESDEPT